MPDTQSRWAGSSNLFGPLVQDGRLIVFKYPSGTKDTVYKLFYPMS